MNKTIFKLNEITVKIFKMTEVFYHLKTGLVSILFRKYPRSLALNMR
jgi:hypothetical protein